MIDLRFYWSLLMRRLPVMLALLIICAAFGVVSALQAPATYSASARLLVEAPQIIADRTGTTTSSAETLQLIEQQLITRANMIDIANKLDVFDRDSTMSVDEKVAAIRANTVIRRSAGRDQAAIMTIGFNSTNARMSAAVVNEYTTLVLSANTRSRIGRAEERLSFFQQEVERLSADLDQQNARILDFKNRNADALPESLNFRQTRQAALQERAARLESELTSLQAQRQDMVRLFEQTGNIQNSAAATTPEQQQLASLRAELNGVLGVYADGSPRVQALRNRIAAAEHLVEVQTLPGDAAQTGNSLLDVNLSQIDSRMTAMQSELTQAQSQLELLEKSIGATSTNAIALNSLERDLMNIQSRYDGAVANLGQARTAERIEASARGERITVLESANVPSQPSGPNRTRIAVMGAGLGVGLAGGFFMLMELLNNAIRRPAELKGRFQVIPLAVIPYIESRQERRHRRTVALALILGVLILIPMGLWGLHTQYMPLDVLAQKVVTRLGLG